MSRYDCASPQDEGATIALLLRRALETPGMTAALVTPDRELARRVAAELRRWDIEIDNSAGVPLGRTPPGVFLRLVLDMAASALAPVPLLAALKHPLAAGGTGARNRSATAPGASKRRSADRARRPASPVSGRRWPARSRSRLRQFVDRIETCLGGLVRLDRSRGGAARRAGLGPYRRRPSVSPRPTRRPASRVCGATRPARRRRGSVTS